MTREELDELEALAALATPGPWTANDCGEPIGIGEGEPSFVGIGAHCPNLGRYDYDKVAASDAFHGVQGARDARLIAAVRNALPELLLAARAVAALKTMTVVVEGTLGADGARCRGCGAAIIYATTQKGKSMPLDAKGEKAWAVESGPDGPTTRQVTVHKPHWATCPDAEQFRRRGGAA